MKSIKNLSFNKKVASLIMAMGFSLCPRMGRGDVISYNSTGAKVYGDIPATLYFTTGNDMEDYAYVSFNNQVGYVYNKDVNYYDFCSNNEYTEINMDMTVNSNQAYIYQEPRFDNEKVLGLIPNNSNVHVIAQNKSGWYVVLTDDYKTGFVYSKNFNQVNNIVQSIPVNETVLVAKITGNNVNVRSTSSTKGEKIGFADKTDMFKILGKEGSWYKIEYLGNIGYIHSDYVEEKNINENEFNPIKMVYLSGNASFYQDINGTYLSTLPKYQNAVVLEDAGNLYKVLVDGIIGYVNKNDTKSLSKNCVVVDLSRQILKVYQNGKEVYRAKVITGRESMQTNIGCFKIGHRMKNYTFQNSDIFNEYWVQFDKNIGLHPADANGGNGWQKKAYFDDSVNNAYKNWMKGNGKTYPSSHGSHGCVNMQLKDIEIVYNLISEKDNVLVIGPNNLVKEGIISENSRLYYYLMVDNYMEDINMMEEASVKKMSYHL